MRIPIPEVVEDFIENAEEYAEGKQTIIADNPEFGFEITLEGVFQRGSLFADLTVWGDGAIFDSKTCYSERELQDTLEEFYESYITPNVIDTIGFLSQQDSDDLSSAFDDDEEEDDDDEREAMLREEELDQAVLTFITSVYGCDPIADSSDYDAVFDELKEALIEVLVDFDPEIYRPLNGDSYPYVNN